MSALCEIDVSKLDFGVKDGKFARTTLQGALPKFKLGSVDAPCRAPFGISTPFSGDDAELRRTMDLEISPDDLAPLARLLVRAAEQDPDCIPLAVPLYRCAAGISGDHEGFERFLAGCLARGVYLEAVQAMAGCIERDRGREAATDFVMSQLLRSPTLGGFVMLLDHLDRDGRPLAADQLGQVRRYSEALLARQTAYRCRNCGFSSHSLMWQCPSCHDWGSCRPIPGADEVR